MSSQTPSQPNIEPLPIASDKQLVFSWQPPSSTGDSPLTGYSLYISDDFPEVELDASATSYNTGPVLTNGVTYSASIKAKNEQGYGPPAYFRPFQPESSPPQPPASATCTRVSPTSASVTWTQPTFYAAFVATPDSVINWYVIRSNPSLTTPTANPIAITASGSTNSYYIQGLTPGAYYAFDVQAVNYAGYSAPTITNTILTEFYPTMIPNLNLWLDPSDASSVTTLPESSNVTAIRDKSGNNNNSRSVADPTYVVPYSEAIPLNVLSISRNGGILGDFTPTYEGYNVTTFIVGQIDISTDPSARMFSLGENGIPDNNNPLYASMPERTGNIPFGAYNYFYSQRDGQFTDSANTGFSNTLMLSMAWVPNSNFLALNGDTAVDYQPTTIDTNFKFKNYKVGAGMDSNYTCFQGQVNEVLVYFDQLSTENRQTIEGYLAWKWGLEGKLPDNHPYKTQKP
jgi:hypothetical protein